LGKGVWQKKRSRLRNHKEETCGRNVWKKKSKFETKVGPMSGGGEEKKSTPVQKAEPDPRRKKRNEKFFSPRSPSAHEGGEKNKLSASKRGGQKARDRGGRSCQPSKTSKGGLRIKGGERKGGW